MYAIKRDLKHIEEIADVCRNILQQALSWAIGSSFLGLGLCVFDTGLIYIHTEEFVDWIKHLIVKKKKKKKKKIL